MAIFRDRRAAELIDLRARRERELARALSVEQRRLIELLERAGRQPVSLRDIALAGFSSPASAIYELEVAGQQIEHVYVPSGGGHRRLAGFRLISQPPPPSAARGSPLRALRARIRRPPNQ